MCLLLEINKVTDAIVIAENMVAQIAGKYSFKGTAPISVSASIGIAIYPADGETADTLLRNADAAMYKAKESGQKVMLFGNHLAGQQD